MRIWWCQEHRAAESAEEGICEVAARDLALCQYSRSAHTNTCRIVPVRLIPDNEETVERIAKVIYGEHIRNGRDSSLAATVLAALDGETP